LDLPKWAGCTVWLFLGWHLFEIALAGVRLLHEGLFCMNSRLSRRDFLASAVVFGAASVLPVAPGRAEPAPLALAIGRRNLEVNGKAASVFGITAPSGAPGITLDPGQPFAVA